MSNGQDDVVSTRAGVIERLGAAGCVAADLEADEMLAAAVDEATLERWISRRERGEPLAWIVGTAMFCGRRISVGPGVYVPRPQTEELARRAAAVLPRGGRALDLCTGSGAVAAHLAAVDLTAAIVAVDLDERATRCASHNGIDSLVGDLDEPLRPDARFDVITAVAPYVPTDALRLLPSDVQTYEPRLALDGGGDGLEVLQRVVRAAGRHLRLGGHLLIEVGSDHDEVLADSLGDAGFVDVSSWYDDDGDLRGIVARRGADR